MASREAATRSLVSPAQLARPRGKVLYWTILALVVIMFTLVFIGPLYWMVTGGLKGTVEAASIPPSLVPKHPQFGNYSQAWTQLELGRLLLNTLYYAIGALLFQLVFDVMAAYALSKLRPMLGNVILGMMLATLMIPSTVLIVAQYVTVLNLPILHLNLVDTPWAIWLPTVTNAFNIFLLKRFFDSIPQDLMSAAAIDGASALRTLRSIVLPMSRPIIGVISIFAITNIWKDFLWPKLVEPSPQHRTVNVGIFAFSTGLPLDVVIAGSAIAAIPAIIFFLIFQRNIMSGLTTGSLKG
jgi:multiple sugar transport system permease protein